jgi:hypothetical protein
VIYPKEVWDAVNNELHGDGGNAHEAIVRDCADVAADILGDPDDEVVTTLLARYGLRRTGK